MNLSRPLPSVSRWLHGFLLRYRPLLPKQRCDVFSGHLAQSGIGSIFVINLQRQPQRWKDLLRELGCICDLSNRPLSERARRHEATDGRSDLAAFLNKAEVDPSYTLADQLYVEPQPSISPDDFDLLRPITMSQAEIAVAHSHISVWKQIAYSDAAYSLVLEDDVWFASGFGKCLTDAWREMQFADQGDPQFDLCYVSFAEVRHGAPKQFLSKNVFRPERGLWNLSGYILSRKGAQALLDLLPCRGPVDLWINHKFGQLDVRALSRSVVNQRRDLSSTNSYSVLSTLTRIGVLDYSDASLFHPARLPAPVFAFGEEGLGLSSLAMALSMLGYRCCSDLDALPDDEMYWLLQGSKRRTFDAYVNIGSLEPHIATLRQMYPSAKFIVIETGAPRVGCDALRYSTQLDGADLLQLDAGSPRAWRDLSEHLRVAPPACAYPSVPDIGMQRFVDEPGPAPRVLRSRKMKHDASPWIIAPSATFKGISATRPPGLPVQGRIVFEDTFTSIDQAKWIVRNDTFPGNLALFRPSNVSLRPNGGLSLAVRSEDLGVRGLSAGALTSRSEFQFGRFEASFQATKAPGVVTGFFLHRSSPRQEIDIEIAGNRPTQMLVNVFYNPGSEGVRYDYGYRGTPSVIELGFDASKERHTFAIEWDACEIRWFVDQNLVHRRTSWAPTPIPHLPMTLHVNSWPTGSRELAGRLSRRSLPATAMVHRIAIDASLAAEREEDTWTTRALTVPTRPAHVSNIPKRA